MSPTIPISYKRLAIVLGLLAACLVIYAYFIEPRRLVISRTEIYLPNWDPAHDAFRIAAISDLHAGSNAVDENMLKRVVQAINMEEPDIVVMLGDYLSGDPLKMDQRVIADSLSGIRSRYGVYIVMGNHDSNIPGAMMGAEFMRVGYHVLDGKLAVINVNGSPLRILGLRDHQQVGIWKQYSQNAKQLAAPTEGKGGLIVLQHSPDVLPVITGDLSISSDLRLMIAGHTHGGQVSLPVIGPPIVPSSYGHRYVRGHVKDLGTDLFVTTGIGTSIVPFRFLVPPEVAIVTLRSSTPATP